MPRNGSAQYVMHLSVGYKNLIKLRDNSCKQNKLNFHNILMSLEMQLFNAPSTPNDYAKDQ